MANLIIELNSTKQPYYVDQFGTPARPADTIQWKSTGGKFSVTIRDTIQFFSGKTGAALKNIEKILVDSAGQATSDTYTIKNDLLTGTEKQYEVYYVTNQDQADAPPRIIITPAV